MAEYYTNLSDTQIEERIKKLAPNQRKKFEQAMLIYDDRRRAFSIASSYPIIENEK